MTKLRLYNTLTKTKETFVPLDANNVRMYVCGPTVYDYAHIGNARPAIVFDVLYRLLRHLYGAEHVTYVRNITDIDDKIIERAKERGISIRDLTEQTYAIYKEDVRALGCLDPNEMPRATDYVPQMIAMIKALIDAGAAYPAQGHVLFDVSSKADYGKLARRSIDDMIAGARVDVAPYKKNPMDFVLWKPSDADTPGWESPWGRGRPGWHLECSAMIEGVFRGTDTIDIHGGGIDLVFPHHENEIAQSECAHRGHPLAKVWMHNGFLNVEGEKMSKSLGNFVTINDLFATNVFGGRKWSGEILRLAMLLTHYRQPIDWTLNRLQEAQARLTRWLGPAGSRGVPERSSVSSEFLFAISDDLDLNMGFMLLDDLATQHRSPNEKNAREIGDQIAATLMWLGIAREEDFAEARADSEDLRATIRAAVLGVDKKNILAAIEARLAARKAKDFKESDRIRDELLAQGIVLKDNADGTTSWDVKR